MHALPVGSGHQSYVVGSCGIAVAPVVTALLQVLAVSAHDINKFCKAYAI